ncbi:MAG: hypothetical protein HY901_12035 [Deltaproteobacteria bacterium]|nr:hypothetical protein [Deltaproteobacteria bacterium]
MTQEVSQQAAVARESDWRTPEWCLAAGVYWESWSLNGDACIKVLDQPFAGVPALTSRLTWLVRSFASRCRGIHDATGALAFAYTSPRMPSTLVSMMSIDFELALGDRRLMSERVRNRGGDPGACRWPGLWLEGSADDYVVGRDPLPPTGTPRRKLLLLAEKREAVVTARPTRLAAGVHRIWKRCLDALVALDTTTLGAVEEELAFLTILFMLVHGRSAGSPQPRPSLEESFRKHDALVAELAPAAQAQGLPVVWHALWRLPRAMTWRAQEGEPWMRFPAISFVAAARPLRVQG